MEKSNRAAYSKKDKGFWICGLIGGGVGLAVTLWAALMLPLALVSLDEPRPLIFPIACLCAFVGGGIGGFVSAKMSKSSELLVSLVSAATMLLPMLVTSLLINREGSLFHLSLIAATVVLSAILGSAVIRAISQNRKRTMKKAMKRR